MRSTERNTSIWVITAAHTRLSGSAFHLLLDEDAASCRSRRRLGSEVVQRVRARGLTADAITYSPFGSDEWESCWTLHLRSAPAALVRKKRTISPEASGPAGSV